MIETDRLGLPLMAPEQAQKHITHNEALLALDGIVNLALAGMGLTTPPAEPALGESFAVGAGADGAWSGHDGQLAQWTAAGWRFAVPRPGWGAWDAQEGRLLVHGEEGWVPAVETLDRLGVNATPDATNRLAVRSEAVLLSAIEAAAGGSGDLRLVVNKEAPADSATMLFQSGWSGRAEIGLAGNDDFAVKVSADGASFATALSIEADGLVRLHQMLGLSASAPRIDGGVLTVATSLVLPEPEIGTSDDIETILGGAEGAILVVGGSAGRTLTLKAGLGNLVLAGDRILTSPADCALLIRRAEGWMALG